MRNVQELYRQKLVSAEEAAKVVKSGDIIWAPPASNEPCIFWKALAERKEELEGVTVRQFLSRRNHPHMEPSFAPHIFIECFFVSDPIRDLVKNGYATYVPSNFGDIPRTIRNSHVDKLVMTVSPPDERGNLVFGLGCDYTPAAIEKAEQIIVEVNPNMPRTCGYNYINIADVDMIIECEEPMVELPLPMITKMDETIASYIVDLIDDGSTLQIGIGGVPAAVCKFLKDKKDLGIHTELASDYIIDLVESGALNGSKKSIHKGKIIATIIEGTKEFFDYIDGNPILEMRPVDYTNDPKVIASNYKQVSINATIEVDLFGQCASESIGTMIWGGSGGQADFAAGVNRSPDGKGFIVQNSTAKGGKISKSFPP